MALINGHFDKTKPKLYFLQDYYGLYTNYIEASWQCNLALNQLLKENTGKRVDLEIRNIHFYEFFKKEAYLK
jgi:hypothetical protein